MITGKLISLGPINISDLPSIFLWADDLEAARLNETYRPAVRKSIEEHWLNIGKDPSRVYFAIRKLDAAPIIGYVQISCIDAVHRSATIGIRIGDEINRGHGFGAEAIKLTINYCWNDLNLSRISLVVFEKNERAKKIYSALGFETEGTLRKAVFIDGRWLDVHVMGLLHPSRTNSRAE